MPGYGWTPIGSYFVSEAVNHMFWLVNNATGARSICKSKSGYLVTLEGEARIAQADWTHIMRLDWPKAPPSPREEFTAAVDELERRATVCGYQFGDIITVLRKHVPAA